MARTKYLHADEVAEILGLSINEVYVLLGSGIMRGHKQKQRWLIDKDQPCFADYNQEIEDRLNNNPVVEMIDEDEELEQDESALVMTSLKDRIIEFLSGHSNCRAKEIADALGESRTSVNQVLYYEMATQREASRNDNFEWKLTSPNDLIIEYLNDHSDCFAKQIADSIGLTRRLVNQTLYYELEPQGIVVKNDHKKWSLAKVKVNTTVVEDPKVAILKLYPYEFEPWDYEEDREVRLLHSKGWSAEKMVVVFERSEKSIQARMKELGLL